MRQAFTALLALAAMLLTEAAYYFLFPVAPGDPSSAFLVAAAGALLGGAAKKAFGKAVSWVGRQTVGGAIAKGAGAVATGVAINRATRPGPMPPSLPQLTPVQGRPVPQSGPVRRTIEKIVPGGRTGYEFTEFEGTERDRIGRPIAVYPDKAERLVAPTGYVIVYPWGEGEQPIAMLKGAARALGLWKARPKPPVSGWDMRAITRAASAKKRVKSLAGKVGLKTTTRGR